MRQAAKQGTKYTNKPYAIVNTASKEYIIATARTWLVRMVPDSAVFSCFYPTKWCDMYSFLILFCC